MRISTNGGGNGNRLLLFAMLLGAMTPLEAGEFAYGLGYMATRSDNITRVPSGELRETIHSYLAGLSYFERTSDIDATVMAQAEFRDYQDDIYDDETVFNLKTLLYWTISPQRFIWAVEDTFEQTRISAAEADTPDNRANVNVFSTGPDVYFRFNPVHTLALGARAGNVYTGRANTDNDRFSGTARWLYQATSISTYSLNYEVQDVTYDDSALNADFTSQDIFLRADYRPSQSQYVIDLGASRISPDQGEDLDESLLRLSWIRHLTTESTFGVSASGEYSDAAADILAASTATAPSAAQTSGEVRSDVYYAKRASLFYNRRGARFGTDLSLYTQDLDYETTPQDRKEYGGHLRLSFFYSGTTTVALITDQNRAEYREFVRRDTDRDSSIRLDYRLSRSVSLALEGRRTERASTIPTEEYVDNRVSFSVLYSSSPVFSPVSTR
jgi:hypothetical protein